MSVTTFAGEQAYLANARSVGFRWRGYLGFAVLPVIVIAVALVTPAFPLKQFYVGFAVGGVVMMLALSVARFDSQKMRGHLAETFSVESLRKVPGWTVIENLPFDGVDVDHVVITPSGLLAVETKFFGPVTKGSSYERERAASARWAAAESARKVRSLLRSKKLHDVIAVAPVLMVWGPGAPDFAEGHRRVHDVYVVQAEYPNLWSHLFQAPLVSAVDRARVRTAIDEFLVAKRTVDAEKTPPLGRRLWAEFRDGMHAERAARATRVAQAKQLRQRHRRRRQPDDCQGGDYA
jgi:hypothetical protein